ncbi:hypothetical protein [Clostridium kluyveri]|uniref:Uncharacterized protein n=1 Tax=Clostridium kluyveri TaxID=1534 RepID=A0A1L5F2R6_CLOKL|nr:hypothetical protein [Clostridium kluyveri]APM37293.1 hypothetical protein BS101_00200 [Clostridium kluyveri]
MNINDLDKALRKSLGDFSYEMEVNANNTDGSLNKSHMEEISKQVFYTMNDFRKGIIEYLKQH